MREMEDFNRAKSDSRIGAVLAGGQEQSRLAGLERDRASFQNQAQGQQFNQNLQQGAFFNQAQQQQYDQAMGRTAFANQAQAQRFGQNAQNAAFRNASRQSEFNARQANANLDNSLRSQILQERLTLRNQPINEITAMMAGSQVQNPGLTAPNMAQIPTTDFAGITNQAYQNQLNAWQMQNANQQSLFGGILGLGSNLIMSDRRQKRNIKRVGRVGGLNVYEYKYVDGTRKERGYMADEVQKVKPEAVVQIGDYLALDYRHRNLCIGLQAKKLHDGFKAAIGSVDGLIHARDKRRALPLVSGHFDLAHVTSDRLEGVLQLMRQMGGDGADFSKDRIELGQHGVEMLAQNAQLPRRKRAFDPHAGFARRLAVEHAVNVIDAAPIAPPMGEIEEEDEPKRPPKRDDERAHGAPGGGDLPTGLRDAELKRHVPHGQHPAFGRPCHVNVVDAEPGA
ncbi:MAG: tail fiber domain-containing protein, partial [Pseudomonadota bacterium]